jgi:hypothetical protein
VPPAVVVHPGSKGAIARQDVVEPVWPAGAPAWLSIWASRVREWELTGTLVVAVAVRLPVTRIETNAMAVRFYF